MWFKKLYLFHTHPKEGQGGRKYQNFIGKYEANLKFQEQWRGMLLARFGYAVFWNNTLQA